MKLILGFLLIAVAFAAIYRQKIHHQPSLKQRLMLEGKLPEYLAKKEALLAKRGNLASQPVLDFDDMAYYNFIDLGTPGQTFMVFIDSGSSTLWVPDVQCGGAGPQTCGIFCKQTTRENCLSFCRPECCPASAKYQKLAENPCQSKNRYNATLSNTYKSLNAPFDIVYQTGEVKGNLYQDTFCLTNTTFCVTNQGFGSATSIGADFITQPGDGMLGMGWPALAVNNIVPPLFNAKNQGLLTQPIYTVFLANVGAQIGQGGQLTVGDYDQTNCNSAVNWVPLTSQTYWQFKLDGVSAGSYSSNPAGGWQAFSDTASTFMGAPQAVVDGIAQVIGATYNSAFKAYFIDCDARTPDITLSINNQRFAITAKNYILAAGPGLCQFAFFPMQGGGFAPSWMLGPPFIREWCQIHDMGSARIGMAKAIQN